MDGTDDTGRLQVERSRFAGNRGVRVITHSLGMLWHEIGDFEAPPSWRLLTVLAAVEAYDEIG